VIIEVRNLHKEYKRGTQIIRALDGVSLSIERGEFVSIMGPSGSGKSTMLQLMGALDLPTSGQIIFDGQGIELLDDTGLSEFRRRRIGFVFQFFNLLPTMTAFENVMLPMLLDGKSDKKVKVRAEQLLVRIGLKDRMNHYTNELSGGQLQRVAIARALIANPVLILADEPTGNLDSKMAKEVLSLLRELSQQEKQTIVMVTHDIEAAKFGSRVLSMRDGKVESDTKRSL
jgi:putative ABC transport system ATP-binding protein